EAARATGEESVRPSAMLECDQETRIGDVKGSPAYMSPEQASGRIDEVGPASDVFALGATLYAILTGGGPYQGASALSKASRCEFAAPRHVKPGVPAALEEVCLKAMAPKPADRYQTAKALADDVERWLADELVAATHGPVEDRIGRWVKRHLLVIGFAQAGLLVALYFVGRATNLRAFVRADPGL